MYIRYSLFSNAGMPFHSSTMKGWVFQVSVVGKSDDNLGPNGL